MKRIFMLMGIFGFGYAHASATLTMELNPSIFTCSTSTQTATVTFRNNTGTVISGPEDKAILTITALYYDGSNQVLNGIPQLIVSEHQVTQVIPAYGSITETVGYQPTTTAYNLCRLAAKARVTIVYSYVIAIPHSGITQVIPYLATTIDVGLQN